MEQSMERDRIGMSNNSFVSHQGQLQRYVPLFLWLYRRLMVLIFDCVSSFYCPSCCFLWCCMNIRPELLWRGREKGQLDPTSIFLFMLFTVSFRVIFNELNQFCSWHVPSVFSHSCLILNRSIFCASISRKKQQHKIDHNGRAPEWKPHFHQGYFFSVIWRFWSPTVGPRSTGLFIVSPLSGQLFLAFISKFTLALFSHHLTLRKNPFWSLMR